MATSTDPYIPFRSLARERFSLNLTNRYRTTLYSDVPAGRIASVTTYVRTLSWSPLGRLVATGAADRKVRVYNPERANVRYATELRGHSGAVEKVAWKPDMDAELATCATDGTVRFWDVRAKGSTGEVKVGGECFTLVWTPTNGSNELLVGRKVHRLMPVILSFAEDSRTIH